MCEVGNLENNDDLTVLINIYNSRVDLQKAYPEFYEGNIRGLLIWAITHGVTIDSCKEELIPYVDHYKEILKNKNMRPTSYPINKTIINNKTPWDNSKDQYIQGGFKIYWETLRKVAHYQFECISGDPNIEIIDYVIGVVKKMSNGKKLRCGIIGCDEIGKPELRLNDSGIIKEIVVMDIAQGLLSKQQSLVDNEGVKNIEYTYADFNRFILDDDAYDLIWAWGTVHHIDNLNHFFTQIRRGLKPGGLFIMREYVGPNRIQLTDDQLSITNALLQVIPDDYKKLQNGTVKKKEVRVNKKMLIQHDPSESIHSEDIVKTMKNYLEIIQYNPTGGTILQPLLNGIAENFEKDQKGDDLLDAIIEIEKILLKHEILPSDYMFAIAKKGFE